MISIKIYPCDTGGLEIFNYHLANELANMGHKVWILTACNRKKRADNIVTIRLNKIWFFNYTLSVYLNLLVYLLKLHRKIDLIHVPYTSNSPIIYPLILANTFLHLSYVIVIHGGGLYPWWPAFLHKKFFTEANTIIAVSDVIRKEYSKRSGRKIQLLPPLIPFKESPIDSKILRHKYDLNESDIVILSVGSIKELKGSNILLDSFVGLGIDYIKMNNLKLIFAGDGPLRSSLEKIALSEGIYNHVRFLGIIPYEEIHCIYKLSDIYVISSFFEGTPLSLLEAMFNRKPIIGSNINSINTLITDGLEGLLFKKGNPKDLMEKLKILIEDKTLREEMGKMAYLKYKKTFSYDELILDHVQIYNKIKEG